MLVRDLLDGKKFYKEFLDSSEGIATNILADRLNKMVDAGLIEKIAFPKEGREGYRLTERGKSLRPVVKSISTWGVVRCQRDQSPQIVDARPEGHAGFASAESLSSHL